MRFFQVFLKKNSGTIARERLQSLVLADRLHCSPEMTEQMKEEIRQVLSKYMELNDKKVKIQLDISQDAGRGVKHVKTIQIKGL